MVAKGARDRRSSSSTNATTASTTSTKRRVPSGTQEKKKAVKPIGICGFCLGDNDKNSNGLPEDMIHCAECGNSGHPSCLQYSTQLVNKIRTIHWQCIDCKRCIVCNKGDDSLLFCDFCDSGIHPKCCDPPLNTIPKGDFACHLCRHAMTIELTTSPKQPLVKSVSSSSSVRSRRSQNLTEYNDDEPPTILAKNILPSSKVQRIRKKPLNFTEDSSSTPQTSTPLIVRQSIGKKPFVIEPITTPPRVVRRSDTIPIEDLSKANQRKHSTNSISPISASSSIIKKRSRNDSPLTKSQGKKRKESKTEDDQSDDNDDQQKPSVTTKRKLNLDLSKYKNTPAFINDSLPDTITENDITLFLDARKNSSKLITECSDKFHHSTECIDDDTKNTRWPPYIVFGSDLLKTWYSSSYPQEYARVPRLYICEFCLKYMKCEQVYDRHRKTCSAFHPPANEIYHKDDLSVFEVDGNINRIYCQNLCLLAKLFLDHKTLYYDVEPFLFYVLTRNDSRGCHFIGYFSKEKHCPQKYNLSCITVLPNCQRRGYGRFLIEISYLLSQKESQVGTPERPLSTLGAQTYEAYWNIKIIGQLLICYHDNQSKCTLKSIMNETGMAIDDISETLQNLGVLTMKSNGKPVITVDVTQLELIFRNEKLKHAHWVSLDGEFLRFTPVLTPHLLTNEEKAVEKQVKEIQIVFKEIGRDAAEAATLATAAMKSVDGTEVVRYIRRRKFGQKRRSMFIKRRIPVHIHKPIATDSIVITNEDSCTRDMPINADDEHSQEYISRRRISTIDESNKEEEEKTEVKIPMSPIISSPQTPLKPATFKQLKLDQFLKIVRPIPEISAPVDDTPKSNHSSISSPENQDEKCDDETENDDHREQIHPQTTRLTSDDDFLPITNRISSDNSSKPDLNSSTCLTRQTSEGDISTVSSNDSSTTTNTLTSSSTSTMDCPLPLKKRAWTSPDLSMSIDSVPTLSNNDQSNLTRETKIPPTMPCETPSSLSDILANSLLSSSASTLVPDDEPTITRIESQLKPPIQHDLSSMNSYDTMIKPVESIDDESPPSLTSPTSMLVSQSNHYNYSTKTKHEPQTITINNFNTSTNMTYNFGNTSFPYSYPSAPSIDMQPFYYPPTTSMNYMPYYPTTPYPTSSSPMYPSGSMYGNTPDTQSLYYPSNGVHSIPYNGNGTSAYPYPTAQSSTTRRH